MIVQSSTLHGCVVDEVFTGRKTFGPGKTQPTFATEWNDADAKQDARKLNVANVDGE